ncbi:hypothetical protein P885DRAFT_71561 [Corynascus similis CBS 632.67]
MSVLHIIPSDFGLNKQALLPPTGLREICLRSVMSVSWIWNSYSLLTSSHDLLAVLFVSVIRWDRPDEWPPLFGSITDATSQRRFWGVFWHRLHVSLFDSSPCHAASNWVVMGRTSVVGEFRFFISNWFICLLETVIDWFIYPVVRASAGFHSKD